MLRSGKTGMERGEQSSDRVPAETGFQSGVHFLRTGCLRKSSLPDGKRGADGSQNHFRYPAGLFKRKKFRRAESSSAVKGNEAGKLYRKKDRQTALSFSVQFRDAGNCHVNFLYLIPGGIIHDSGLGKTENLLEHLYTVLGLFSVNPIGNNRRNQRIGTD